LTYTVGPKLLAGPYPFDIDALLDAGVTTFIDLTEDGELEPYAVPAGVTHRRFGVADRALERVRELTGGPCPEVGEQEALVLRWNRQNGPS
jgi:hypothetical protein